MTRSQIFAAIAVFGVLAATPASAQWRHGGWHSGYHHGGWHRGGYGVGAGLATGLIVGGALAAANNGYYGGYYDTGPGYVGGGNDAYCMQRYRSYDPASGTYLGYDGQRHPC